MAISYKKLRELLFDLKINFKTLGTGTGISHATLSRINKDEYLTLQNLEVIANYLSKVSGKRLQLSDLVTLKDGK